MVIISYAQSQAFNYTQFQISEERVGHAIKQKKDNCLITFFKILFATTDVLDDAHSTFLKEEIDDNKEKETQIAELSRGKSAFTWSDDEECESGGIND